MSLTNDTGTTMLVQPACNSGYGNGGGFGFGGDNAWWIVLFLIFGWGRNGFGGGYGDNGGMNGGIGSEVQRGFDHSSVVSKLDGITQGICDSTYALNNAITNGFHGVDSAICGLGTQVMQGFNSTNVALLQGQNAMAAQLADCCCTTQRAIDGVNYNLATQACDTRNTIQNTTRDIIDNQNANSRAILDFLTQDKISTLQAENQALKFQASQTAQNGFIDAVGNSIVAQLRMPTPVPAYQVANPYASYGHGYGCGGCGSCCG